MINFQGLGDWGAEEGLVRGRKRTTGKRKGRGCFKEKGLLEGK